MKGLYIHIPFCHKICSYCDFVKRIPKSKESIDDYLRKLVEEITLYQSEFDSIETIYIGGGTPSLLDIDQLTYLFESLKSIRPIEYTIEINPETYTHEKGKLFKKYGLNRFSLGVETFDDSLLKVLKRSHTNEDVYNTINSLISIGLSNINIDMMYATPGQTLEMLELDLSKLIELNPIHVSYYSLIYEEHTYLYYKYKRNQLDVVDNDIEAIMYGRVIDELKYNGYNHYEISNFSKDGYESKHNLIYWTLGEYIGVGLGASGFFNNVRTLNTANMNLYLDNKFIMNSTPQIDEFLLEDEMIFGLRKIDGVNIEYINNKYNINVVEKYSELTNLIEEGLVEIDQGYLKLTRKGIFFGNRVFMVFLCDSY